MRLKKWIVLLALLLLALPARAEEIHVDLSTATLEELTAARDAIQARMDELATEMGGRVLEAGSYLVGRDIAPGVYVLMERENAMLPSFTLRDGETGETLEFEIINRQIVVELLSGQEMQLSDADAYPAALAPEVQVVPGTPLEAGGYWVGGQIPAGVYTVEPAENAIFACYSLYDSPIGTNSRIIEFVMVHEAVQVELREGQYIVISDCTMTASEAQ